MYFSYMINWLYRVMQVPVPLVVSNNIFGLVTVFDLFLFTVYLGVFIVLIKYIITDTLSLDVGGVDINYSSDAYVARHYRNSLSNNIKNSNAKKESVAKRNELLKKQERYMYYHANSLKNSGKPTVKVTSNSMAGRILNKKGGNK